MKVFCIQNVTSFEDFLKSEILVRMSRKCKMAFIDLKLRKLIYNNLWKDPDTVRK
jgi:hypothetical protein